MFAERCGVMVGSFSDRDGVPHNMNQNRKLKSKRSFAQQAIRSRASATNIATTIYIVG
jgi:hypothetical protein